MNQYEAFPTKQVQTLHSLLSANYKSNYYGLITPLCQNLHPFFVNYQDAILEFGSEKCYSNMVILDQNILTNFPKFFNMFKDKFGEEQLIAFVLKANLTYMGIQYNHGVVINLQTRFTIHNALELVKNTQDGCLLIMSQYVYENLLSTKLKIDQDEHINFIRQFDAFIGLEKYTTHVLKCLDVRHYNQGQIVYDYNEKANEIFFIKNGEFKMFIQIDKKHVLMEKLLSEIIENVKQQYQFQLNVLDFGNFQQHIHVQTYQAMHYFGEQELMEEGNRRYQVECSSASSTVYCLNWSKLQVKLRGKTQIIINKIQEASIFRKKQIENQVSKALTIHILKVIEFKKLENKTQEEEQAQVDITQFYVERKNPFLDTSYKMLRAKSVQPNLYFSNKEKYDSKSSLAYLDEAKNERPNNYSRRDVQDQERQFYLYKHPNNENAKIYKASKKIQQVILFPRGKIELDVLNKLNNPKSLGRYQNYEGASSQVASYLRNLPENIKQKMMASNDYQQKGVSHSPRYRERGMTKQNQINKTFQKISEIHNNQLLQSYFEVPEAIDNGLKRPNLFNNRFLSDRIFYRPSEKQRSSQDIRIEDESKNIFQVQAPGYCIHEVKPRLSSRDRNFRRVIKSRHSIQSQRIVDQEFINNTQLIANPLIASTDKSKFYDLKSSYKQRY